LGNPISGPQLRNLEECEYKYGCSGICVPLQDRLVNLLNCLNDDSLKVIPILFLPPSTMGFTHGRGDKSGSFSVCVHGKSTFWLNPALNSLKTTDCASPDWTFCGVLCVVVFRDSKFVCVANPFVPLCHSLSLTVHDTRVMAKERQKKNNHNLSKCLPAAFQLPHSPSS